MLRGRAEHVEDAAADRELAALLDHVDAGVGQLDQALQHALELLLLADLQVDRRERAQARRHRLDEAADGRDDDAGRRGAPQAVQHFQAPADGVRARGQALVGQRFPGREVDHLIGAEQGGQRRGQLVGLSARGGDGEDRPALFACFVCGQRGHDELTGRDGALDL